MLSNTLNTNEIKDAAAAAVAFERISSSGRTTEFAKVGEVASAPQRLKISHLETGAGTLRRRRSVIRFDVTERSNVDATKIVVASAYVVLDAPVGAFSNNTVIATPLSYLQSFLSTTGAGTTVLFDNTGNGAKTLMAGSI